MKQTTIPDQDHAGRRTVAELVAASKHLTELGYPACDGDLFKGPIPARAAYILARDVSARLAAAVVDLADGAAAVRQMTAQNGIAINREIERSRPVPVWQRSYRR